MPSSHSRPYEAGSSFRPAFLVLAPGQRRALSALYGYARAADDIADDPAAGTEAKEAALDAWKGRIESLFGGGRPEGRLETELAWAAGAFSMDPVNLLLLLEGLRMDVRHRGYPAFEDLKPYMYRVASAVGLSCLEIFGWRGETAKAYAENLGYAVQLTNIIRDVFEDARAGRVYVPEEDLVAAGCDRSALARGEYPEGFPALMRLEAERARGFYAAAEELARKADGNTILSARIMARLYADLLEKIEKRGFRTAGERITLNGFEKARAVYRAWSADRATR